METREDTFHCVRCERQLITRLQLATPQLADTERERIWAVVAAHEAGLSICADQLSYGHSAGRIETKAQFIDGAVSGRSVWKFITLTDQSHQIVGNNAIVRHLLTGETESEGKTNAIKIGVLMVWQKQDGRWKLLSRQAYRL